jgi:hypothetical protein
MGVVEELRESLARLESLCSTLTVEQLSFRSVPGGWSVEDCVEHLATTERFVLISIRRALQSEAAGAEQQQAAAAKSEWLAARVGGRTRKVMAPPQAQPQGRYGAWPGSWDELRQGREKLLEIASGDNPAWTQHLSPHPLMGDFNASQWLVFAEAHTRRHLAQIEEILADPNFPKA